MLLNSVSDKSDTEPNINAPTATTRSLLVGNSAGQVISDLARRGWRVFVEEVVVGEEETMWEGMRVSST